MLQRQRGGPVLSTAGAALVEYTYGDVCPPQPSHSLLMIVPSPAVGRAAMTVSGCEQTGTVPRLFPRMIPPIEPCHVKKYRVFGRCTGVAMARRCGRTGPSTLAHVDSKALLSFLW